MEQVASGTTAELKLIVTSLRIHFRQNAWNSTRSIKREKFSVWRLTVGFALAGRCEAAELNRAPRLTFCAEMKG